MNTPVDTADGPVSEGSSSHRRRFFESSGEYRLLTRLGVGGMGQVYKAMHRRLEKLVAVKMLPSYRAADPRALARFDREIKAAGRLNHPNVVQAYDAREIDGTRFLVMEYVDGIDLSALVRYCGPLKIADACELIRQAASGLQAVHEHGLIHRDIKPSNLMLSQEGQLKILDLGLARFRAEPLESGEMTEIGETIGTAEYIAPEQVADSHRVDIRADIYSLGCTMFRLLTGQPPFFGPKYRTAVEKMVAHLKEPVPSVRLVRSEISESLAAVFARMVAKDPSDRFTTPQEAGSNLRELARQSQTAIRGGASESSSAASSSSSAESLPVASTENETRGGQSPAGPAVPDDLPPPAGAWFPSTRRRRWTAGVTALRLLVLVLLIGLVCGLWVSHTVRKDKPVLEPSAPLPALIEIFPGDLPQGKWIDVLPCADLDRDQVSDLWERRKDGIGCRGSNGFPRLMLPVVTQGDYDCEIEFTRNSGSEAILILLPVGDENMAQLYLSGKHGEAHGVVQFGGPQELDPANASRVCPGVLANGRHYTALTRVRIQGDEAIVDLSLDGESLIHYKAQRSAFSSFRAMGSAEANRPAVGVDVGTDATFHRASVRMAGGKGALKHPRGTEPCSNGQWIDLLARIDLPRDRLDGDFRRDGKDLVLDAEAAECTLMLPAAVRGSYELEIEFTHSPADGDIAFIVPVGLRRVRVNPNRSGDLHANPWSINRPHTTSEGEPGSLQAEFLEGGKRQVMSVVVSAHGEDAAIEVRAAGKPWLSWSGKQLDLHDGPILLPEPDRIGMVASGRLVLHSARLRVTSGKALLLPHIDAL